MHTEIGHKVYVIILELKDNWWTDSNQYVTHIWSNSSQML